MSDQVALRILHLRKDWSVNQTEFGKFCGGKTKGTVSFWERGETEPGRDALLALQASKGIRPGWLLTGKEPKFEWASSKGEISEPKTAYSVNDMTDQEVIAKAMDLLKERAEVGSKHVPKLARMILAYFEGD